jgi:quercetin dioxygenase-like cupin family protein
MMHIMRFKTAATCEPEPGWKRVSVCSEAAISMEHFVKPAKHASPRHSHANAQVMVVLKGRLAVAWDGGEEVLEEGDTAYMPGKEPHAVINPDDTVAVGLDIFLPGRSFDFWLKRKAQSTGR